MPLRRSGVDPVPGAGTGARDRAGAQTGPPVRAERVGGERPRRGEGRARRHRELQQRHPAAGRLGPEQAVGGHRRSGVHRPAGPHPAAQAADARVHQAPAGPAGAGDREDRQRPAGPDGGQGAGRRHRLGLRLQRAVPADRGPARRRGVRPRPVPRARAGPVRPVRWRDRGVRVGERVAGLPVRDRPQAAGEPRRRADRVDHPRAGRRHRRHRARRARGRGVPRRVRDVGEHARARHAGAAARPGELRADPERAGCGRRDRRGAAAVPDRRAGRRSRGSRGTTRSCSASR